MTSSDHPDHPVVPPTATPYYITGGTLRYDARCYVERLADKDLLEGLVQSDFCYVLTSRQMGKSSLMVRTARRLREQGAQVVALDLTAIGQNLTADQWYDGLLTRLGQQLGLEDGLEGYWREHARLGPVQRLFGALREVALHQRPGTVVVFIDEIDTVRSLPFSTDEFFAAIRECYNRRTEDAEFMRLTFCLLGVATPSDLIRDTRTTPFNIGHRIELHDFTFTEGLALVKGLNRAESAAQALWQRVFHWTQGHPYLTQRLCQEIVAHPEASTAAAVDDLAGQLFFSARARERDDNLIFVRERLLQSGADLAGLLTLYQQVHAGRQAIKDDETNALVNLLRLAGIVRVEQDRLQVRNRIYQRVFDEAWVRTNMPDAEKRRQREAFHKGLIRGLSVAGAILLLLLAGMFLWNRIQKAGELERVLRKVGTAYQNLNSYQDLTLFKTEMQMAGTSITWDGSCQLSMARPNKLALTAKMNAGLFGTHYQFICDGKRIWFYVPALNQYLERDAPPTMQGVFDEIDGLGVPLADFVTFFHVWLRQTNLQQTLADQVPQLRFLHREPLDGEPVCVVTWSPSPTATNGFPATNSETVRWAAFPTTVWVTPDQGLLRQCRVDMSQVVTQTSIPNPSGGAMRMIPLQRFVPTVKYTAVQLNPTLSEDVFRFRPPPGAEAVTNIVASAILRAPERLDVKPKYSKGQLGQLLPPRSTQTPAQLIDLSAYYNAPLTVPWHSDRAGNDLSSLPRGSQTLSRVAYDIRGIVQLAGRAESYLEATYPEHVKNIKIEQRCRRLHFLQGAGWQAPDGTHLGNYVVHYANQDLRIIPIIYGFDVRNWWAIEDEPTDPTGLEVAWTGKNEACSRLRLYHRAWENPLPEVPIQSLDFVSSLMDPAPFLIAITVEP